MEMIFIAAILGVSFLILGFWMEKFKEKSPSDEINFCHGTEEYYPECFCKNCIEKDKF